MVYLQLPVLLAFLPHISPKYKSQILPALENDDEFTWQNMNLSALRERWCVTARYEQSLKIHIHFVVLSTHKLPPTYFIHFYPFVAV